jgi:hypothetical protein
MKASTHPWPWLIAALATVVSCVVLAVPSWASGPTRTPERIPTVRLSSGICGFPVLVRPLADRGVLKTFPDGHMLVTGALKESMTNLRNGHHITVNTSGPVRISILSNGETVVLGHGSGWIAEDHGSGGQGGFLIETRGQVVVSATTFGLVHGTSRNICPLIR